MKLSSRNLSEPDSRKLNMLLHSVGDLERISDHAINLVDCAKTMNKKEQHFSGEGDRGAENFFTGSL